MAGTPNRTRSKNPQRKAAIAEQNRAIKEFFHFDLRDALNRQGGVISTESEIRTLMEAEGGNGWEEMKGAQADFHQNGVGKRETKFININGRELIFDGDTGMLIDGSVDPTIMGTFNYVNAAVAPENPTMGQMARATLLSKASMADKRLDVDLWIEMGSSRNIGVGGDTSTTASRSKQTSRAFKSGVANAFNNSLTAFGNNYTNSLYYTDENGNLVVNPMMPY